MIQASTMQNNITPSN